MLPRPHFLFIDSVKSSFPMRSLKTFLALLLLAIVVAAHAETASIRLTSFPDLSVADARSTVTISLEVLTSSGRPVPDGTQVLLSTDKGTFKTQIVTTLQGRAQAVLVAPSTPGTAKIVAISQAPSGTATMEFEFLSDRSLLSSARDYVEIVAPGYMMFSLQNRVVEAAGPKQAVYLRYHDIEIDAEDLQLDIPNYVVRARKAHVKMGKMDQEFGDLYLKLNTRKGYGTTTYPQKVTTSYKPFGNWLIGVQETKERYAMGEITASGMKTPSIFVPDSQFEFQDITEAASLVSAKKAIVFPSRVVQFQRAEVVVGGVKVLKMPLFEVPLNGSSTGMVTDQIVNVNDNQVAINYPMYLTLKPGETSLLRFRTGQSYGRGVNSGGGAYLDYEMNWDRGNNMQGGLLVSGLARKDWAIGAHQYLRFSDDSSLNAQVQMPGSRSIFGSVGWNKQFRGYALNLAGTANQAVKGERFSSQDLSLSLDRDPIKMGPTRLIYGLTASDSRSSSKYATQRQSGAGFHIETQLVPKALDKRTTLNGSLGFVQLFGGASGQGGRTVSANLSLASTLSRSTSVVLSYDFLDDGFNSRLLGRQRMTLQANYDAGRMNMSFYGSKSLDFDRLNYFADISYRLTGLWKLSYSHTFDRYLEDESLDYNAMISYRIGFREVGLTWSNRTKRFGIQLFGASLN